MTTDRRSFLLQTGAFGLYSFGAAPPQVLLHAAEQANSSDNEKVLVIIQMAGGNDGLNTVVPRDNDDYHRARPGIGIDKNATLRLNDDLGLHPGMSGLKGLWDEGQLQIVQGVGYPNPDRSHFRSMDIWHTANLEPRPGQDGWLGRALTSGSSISPSAIPAMTLGMQNAPWAFQSSRLPVAAIREPSEYRWQTMIGEEKADQRFRKAMKKLASTDRKAANQELDFVRSLTRTAYSTAEKLEEVAEGYTPSKPYPQSGLGQKLKYVAQFIEAGLGVRVFYLSLDGFDTHAQQEDAHAGLLTELSEAINAFVADLQAHKLFEQVCICTFSEFGRRVKENGSLGTDHGAASQMFVVSEERAGLRGEHPSLSDLDDGDLKFHTDFRSVYASLLDQWMTIDPSKVVGAEHKPIELL